MLPSRVSSFDIKQLEYPFILITAPIFISSLIGVIFGYFLTASATSFYVDFDRIPSSDIPDIPQDDPRWIGAWWLGFLASGTLLMIFALPLFFFPRKMKLTSHASSEIGEKETEEGKDVQNEKENDSVTMKPHDKENVSRGQVKSFFGILKGKERIVDILRIYKYGIRIKGVKGIVHDRLIKGIYKIRFVQ